MDAALIHKRLRGLALKRAGFALGVHGAAGIGKTHAVSKLLQDAPCAFSSQHASTPFSALLQNLPKPRALPAWALAITAKLERGEFIENAALLDTIQATLSGNAPLILHLEDIHEVSPDRLEELGKLAEAVKRTHGVALIVTSRHPPSESFEAVPLEPLTEDETRALLEGEVAASLPTAALSWIYVRAAGNPLFSLEFLRHLARQGYAWNDGRRWHWRAPPGDTLPVTIEALIEQLLTGAADTPDLEAVLAVRALLPVHSSDALCAAVADLETGDFKLAQVELERRGVLKIGEFAHPLYREVARQRLLPTKRRDLARKAIAALESDPRRAIALLGDADLAADAALGLLERAAAMLEAAGDRLRAAAVLASATRFASGETQGRIALRALRGLIRDADAGRLAQMAELAAATLPDGDERSEALLILAERHAREGQRSEMQATLERLPAEVCDGPIWLARLIHANFDSGDYAQVLTIWNAHSAWQPHCSSETAHRVAYAHIESGNLDAATRLAQQTLERSALTELERASQLDILATVAFYAGRYAETDAHFAALAQAYRTANDQRSLANTLRNRSVNRLQLGLYRESLPDFEESLNIYQSWGAAVGVAQTQIMVSPVYQEIGDFERAESALRDALEVLQRIPAQPFLVYGLVAFATLYLRWKPLHGAILAQKHAREALEVAQQLDNPVLLANALIGVSSSETSAGRAARGLELADQALSFAQRVGFAEALMSAHKARGEALLTLERRAEAREAFSQAAQLCADTGLVLEGHFVGLELDRLANDLPRAQTRLQWFRQQALEGAVCFALEKFPELADRSRHDAVTAPNAVRFEVLGAMQLAGVAVRGRKRQELLIALLEARIALKTEVTRLELLDALYPDEDEDRAGSSLKELVRSTRASFGAQTIQTTANGYALGAVKSDAEQFLQTGDPTLWRGAYLGGLGSGNDAVRESLHLALSTQAEQRLESDALEAARLGKLLLEFDPYNQAHLRLTLIALRATDQPKIMQRLYIAARDRMSEVGEVLPERWQDFLLETASA